jgi:hypothetical protein
MANGSALQIPTNQRMHAEPSNDSWAMVNQLLGPRDPGRYLLQGNLPDDRIPTLLVHLGNAADHCNSEWLHSKDRPARSWFL